MHDDLSVAAGAENMPQRLEFGNQVCVGVDLAVEYHDYTAVFVVERLLARREIDDGEAAMPEANPGFEMQPALVGAAVKLGLVHTMEQVSIDVPPPLRIEYACYAAHQVFCP